VGNTAIESDVNMRFLLRVIPVFSHLHRKFNFVSVGKWNPLHIFWISYVTMQYGCCCFRTCKKVTVLKRSFNHQSWEVRQCVEMVQAADHSWCRHTLTSVVVHEGSPCPQGPIYKSLSSNLKSLSTDLQSLSLDHRVLESCWGLRILQIVCYIWSCDVHKFSYWHRAWGYGQEWHIYWIPMSPSMSSCVVVLEDPQPMYKFLSLSSWTSNPCPRIINLYSSPCPRALSPCLCPQASSPW